MAKMIDLLKSVVFSKLFIKLLLEFLPLGLFFIFTDRYDIYVGTAVLMAATVVSMALIWHFYRRIAIMAIITAVTGLISGGMTLYFTDPLFVKLKPTIVSFLFAAILFAGLAVDRPLLKTLLGEDLNLTHEGWRVITWRWMWYFVFIAILNEVVWRGADWIYQAVPHTPHMPHPSDKLWAGFKAFGLMPLTILYAAMQISLLTKYRADASVPMGGGHLMADGGKKPAGGEPDKSKITAGAAVERG